MGRPALNPGPSWPILADPEKNEFCAVRPKKALIR
jgi:hypothetical protein